MRNDIVKDTIDAQATEAIQFAFKKMEQSINGSEFALDIKQHITTFNTMIDIHNAQITSVIRILTDSDNESIPWPSTELCTALTISKQTGSPPIHWNNRKTLETLSQVLNQFFLPHMEVPDLTFGSPENPKPALLRLKRCYEDYIGTLSGSPIQHNGTALLSYVWNRIAIFERDLLAPLPINATEWTKPRVAVFQFSKIGSSFVGDALEALAKELFQRAAEISGGDTKFNSPWYDWRRIQPAMQQFEEEVDGIVDDWQTQVLDPWQLAQETAKEARKEQQRSRELDSRSRLTDGSSAFDSPGSSVLYSTPTRSVTNKRPLVLSSPAESFNGIDFGTPIPQSKLFQQGFSSFSLSPSNSSTTAAYHHSRSLNRYQQQPPTATSSAPLSEYASLKQRVQEALALSRLEIANSKRRLAE
ncbi:UNVERIFIED_CONTAM: hypothetical protein HDU68_004891 [Siphonaria sp. JEL0065]|nr:hypothetical protein HDU68_004891 [Siphonaria sp. JEL0065]